MSDKIIKRIKIRIKDYRLNVKVKIFSGYVINANQSILLSEKYDYGFLKLDNVKRNRLQFSGHKGISLYERLKNPISDHDIFSFLEQIVDALEKIARIGLARSNLVLDLKYIFLNEAAKELTFMYLPIATPHGGRDILETFEQIIYSVVPLEIDSNCLSDFSRFIKRLDGFDAKKIEKYISDNVRGKMASSDEIRGTVSRQPDIRDEKIEPLFDDEKTELMSDDESTYLFAGSPQNSSQMEERRILGIVDDGNTCMLEDEATELLEEEKTDLLEEENVIPYSLPVLIRNQTDEVVRINKPVFRIGKEENCVDYVVTDNAAISRSHVDIISRNGRYFVFDLRSKNKTYLNNRVLPAEQEVEIFNGDILRLANEDFCFKYDRG